MDVLDDLGIYDDLIDMTKTANTKEDVLAVFQRFEDTLKQYAKDVLKDPVGMSPENPALDVWGKLSDVQNQGYLEKGVSEQFAAVMQAARNAELEYKEILQKTVNSFLMNDKIKPKERSAIANAFEDFSRNLNQSGASTKAISNQIVDSAWTWTDESKGSKDDAKTLMELWDKAGIEGVPPANLNKKTLLNELWKQTKSRQDIPWRPVTLSISPAFSIISIFIILHLL